MHNSTSKQEIPEYIHQEKKGNESREAEVTKNLLKRDLGNIQMQLHLP